MSARAVASHPSAHDRMDCPVRRDRPVRPGAAPRSFEGAAAPSWLRRGTAARRAAGLDHGLRELAVARIAVIAEAVPGFERVHMARMSPDNPAGQMRCPGPADCVRRPEWTDYGEVDPVVILAALHDLPSRPPVPDERARALLRRAADVPGDHTPAAQVDAYARHVMAVVPPAGRGGSQRSVHRGSRTFRHPDAVKRHVPRLGPDRLAPRRRARWHSGRA